MKEFFKQFFPEEDSGFSVIVEDDGKVAYAYLLENDDIVSDVWLYNSSEPLYSDWESINEKDFPLQNLEAFIIEKVNPIEKEEDIRVEWAWINSDLKVYVYLYNKLTAILEPNEKPGCNMFVNTNTSIARLNITQT